MPKGRDINVHITMMITQLTICKNLVMDAGEILSDCINGVIRVVFDCGWSHDQQVTLHQQKKKSQSGDMISVTAVGALNFGKLIAGQQPQRG
jgi:hypothetical protein